MEERAVEEMQRLVKQDTDEKQNEALKGKASKLVNERLKDLGVDVESYARRDEVMSALADIKKEMKKEIEDFKALLLKKKAQGKANLSGSEEEKKDELQEIYKDLGIFE